METCGNGEFPYDRGYKHCVRCMTNIKWAGIYCPCCCNRLRNKNRYGRKNKWTYDEWYYLKTIKWCSQLIYCNKEIKIEKD